MTTATLKYTVHLDDFHQNYEATFEWPEDGTQPPEVAPLLVEWQERGYDVDRVTLDGRRWVHYSYGAQWGPEPLRGWQDCPYCKGHHPVTSEC